MSERDLVRHVAGFCSALREARVPVGLADEIVGSTALTLIDVGDRAEIRRAFLAALRIRPPERPTFDALFDRWWGVRPRQSREPRASSRRRSDPKRGTPSGQMTQRMGLRDAGEARPAAPEDDGIGYSPEALLRRKPFEAWTEQDLRALDRVMSRIAERLATRRSRRFVPTRSRGVVDLRRSLRAMTATRGEPIRLAHRTRPIERPRVALLCDTSGSMDPHAKFLLTFALSLRRVVRRLHVFAFNTELRHITPSLSQRTVTATMERLTVAVPDWAGGTRIGDCLAAFVRWHLARTVDSKTAVVILSDGLDRGDPRVVAEAMSAIHRAARRVIWLNPLKGDERYEPAARGMAAALPYIDHLAAAHNVESLERVIPLLTA